MQLAVPFDELSAVSRLYAFTGNGSESALRDHAARTKMCFKGHPQSKCAQSTVLSFSERKIIDVNISTN